VHIPECVELLEGASQGAPDIPDAGSRNHHRGKIKRCNETPQRDAQIVNCWFARTAARARQVAEKDLAAVLKRMTQHRADPGSLSSPGHKSISR